MSRPLLFVDDDPPIGAIAKLSLELTGEWTVHLAESGEEALELAKELEPVVILLDVNMPVMDGPATLERLQADPDTREVPVIFLTATVGDSELEKLRGLGVIGVLSKPFQVGALSEQIKALLAGE